MVVNSCFEGLEGRMGKNRVREFIPKAGKMPGSGCSCDWDRAGSARSCTSCPCRASDETPACTVARVKTRSGNARGELADPADGQRSGWVGEFGMDGFCT